MTTTSEWKPRELEILGLLVLGLTNSEIGARLYLSDETIRWYNKHIFRKLGVKTRFQAVHRATELGLFADTNKPFLLKTALTPSRSQVQYVANGDVHIAYQVIGSGPNDLLFIHGFLSHLEQAWENSEFASFFEQLGRSFRVILFDKRGVGLSDRIQGAPTLETTIEDACCVLEAVGAKRAFIMGTSEGGAAAVLLASTYPERVLGLILYAAIPKVVQTNHEPIWADPEDQFERMIDHMQKTWGGPWAIENFAPSRASDNQFRDWWAMILRTAASPSSIKAVLNILREIDIRPLLPQIPVETLIVHKTEDRIASIEAGRYFATCMPNATLVELEGADHIYFVESAALLSAIVQFCQEETADTELDTWLAIILYISTKATGLSSRELQTSISLHNPRHILNAEGEVITLFDSPTRALQCALRLRENAKQATVRLSLHVGACHVVTGKPLESVLATARQVVELADPGEIIVTGTLHDILAGSGFVFAERDVRTAHNSPANIRLYTLI